MNKALISLLFFVLFCFSVTALDFYPFGNVQMQNTYAVVNATNVSAYLINSTLIKTDNVSAYLINSTLIKTDNVSANYLSGDGYSITNLLLNTTQIFEVVNNNTFGRVGVCGAGLVMQNNSVTGPECVSIAAVGDTNESGRVNNIVGDNCSGSNKTIGFDINGNIICGIDIDTFNSTSNIQAVSVGGEVNGTVINVTLSNTALDDQYRFVAEGSYIWLDSLTFRTNLSLFDLRYYNESEVNTLINNSNISMKSYVDAQNIIDQTYTNSTNTSMKSYVDAQDVVFNNSIKVYIDSQDTAFNDSMKVYVDSQNILDQAYTNSTNTSMGSYVNSQDTVFNDSIVVYINSQDVVFNESIVIYINAQNILDQAYTNSTNTSMKSYVDSQNILDQAYTNSTNTSMKSYVNAQDILFNESVVIYIDSQDVAFNESITIYVDAQNVLDQAYTNSTNTSMKSYVDSQDLSYNNSIVDYVDTQDTAFNESIVIYINSQDTVFNDSIKIYIDAQNVLDQTYTNSTNASMKSYVDSQDTAINGTSLHLNGDNWNGDDWITWSNPNFVFNESQLATVYYDVATYALVTGTVDGGNLSYINHSDGNYDSQTFNFTEASGSPGLDIRMNFTDITSFNQGIMRYYTSSLAGDYPVIQLWSYDSSEWEDYPVMGESETYAAITQQVFDSSSHISGGIVQMRIYKAANGNTGNHYFVDWISISKGFGTPSGSEVDPFSIHINAINDTQFYYDSVLILNHTWLISVINSIDSNTNDSMKSYVDAQNILDQTYTNLTNTSMKSYVDSQDVLVNSSMKDYVNSENTAQNDSINDRITEVNSTTYAYIDAQNVLDQVYTNNTNASMKVYVDAQDVLFNTSITGYVDAIDVLIRASIETNYTASIAYTDTQNATMTTRLEVSEALIASNNISVTSGLASKLDITDQRYNDTALINGNNVSMKSYVDSQDSAFNDSIKIYIDAQNILDQTYTNSTNTSMKSYVDARDTLFNTSVPDSNDIFVAVNNGSYGRVGNCGAGTFMQNNTATGPECVSAAAASDTNESGRVNLMVGNNCTGTDKSFGFNDNGSIVCAADVDTDTTYDNGSGIGLTDTTFSHADTSSEGSSDNSDRTYIQDIALDAFGHVTSIGTASETVTDTNTYNDTDDIRTAINFSSISFLFDIGGKAANASWSDNASSVGCAGITGAASDLCTLTDTTGGVDNGSDANFNVLEANDWSNITITESQVTDLAHNTTSEIRAAINFSSISFLFDISGVAATATALAANGGNCNAGEYPLGVDASGAVEDCTDATTEINTEIGNVLDGTDAFTDFNGNDIIDSDNYNSDSIDNEHINWVDIDNLADEGAIVVADTTDTTSYVALWESATGNLAAKSDASITYNAGTGMLSTDLTGGVTLDDKMNASGNNITDISITKYKNGAAEVFICVNSSGAILMDDAGGLCG